MAGNSGRFQVGNPGKRKGTLNKRTRMGLDLLKKGQALLDVTYAAAMSGDMTAMSLLLPRIMPTLKPEGAPTLFELNASDPLSRQIESVLQALANGRLNVDQARQVAEMIKALAEARAADGAGESADKLNAAFRDMAVAIWQNGDSIPTGSAQPAAPRELTPPPEQPPVPPAPTAPPPPPEPGARRHDVSKPLLIRKPWE